MHSFHLFFQLIRKQPISILLLNLLLGCVLSYSIATHFLNLFVDSLDIKIIKLAVVTLLCFGIAIWINHEWFFPRYILLGIRFKCLILSLSFFICIFLFLILPYQYVPFQTTHTLQIIHLLDETQNIPDTIQIEKIYLTDLKKTIPFSEIEKDGNWQIGIESLISKQPGNKLTITKEFLGGVLIKFRKSPHEGMAKIVWDGNEQDVLLKGADEEITQITLPGTSWGSPRLPWKFMAIGLGISDFLSLFYLFILLLISIRYFRESLPIIASSITALSWLYSLATRFYPSFWGDHTAYWIVLIISSIALTIGIYWAIYKRLPRIIHIYPKLIRLTFILAFISTIGLFIFLPYTFLPISRSHSFKIIVDKTYQDKSKPHTITILQIYEANTNNNFPYSHLNVKGSWNTDTDISKGSTRKDYPLISYDPTASIEFRGRTSGNIALKFETSINSGAVKIIWDGKERIDDLLSIENYPKRIILPSTSWGQPDLLEVITLIWFTFTDFILILIIISLLIISFIRLSIKLKWGSFFFFVLGIILLIINMTGWVIPLRNPELYKDPEVIDKISLSVDQLNLVINKNAINRQQYVTELTQAVSKAMSHYWPTDLDKYNIRIPIYENYFLFFRSFFTPLYREYQFVNFKKAIERGFGLCSQQSLALAGILEEKGIESHIIRLSGHVVATAKVSDNEWWVLDPDYGTIIPYDIITIMEKPEIVREYYKLAGYDPDNMSINLNVYNKEGNSIVEDTRSYFDVFDLDYYEFEYFSYIFKWFFPFICLLPWCIYQIRNQIINLDDYDY